MRARPYGHDGIGRGLTDLLAGLLAGCVMIAGFGFDPKLGIAVAGLIVIVPLILLRPSLVFWGAVLAILVFEEFSGGLGEEAAERVARNPFYATSAVIPGLYLPDLLLIVAIGLSALELLSERRPLDFPWDRISRWLVLMTATIVISVVMSFVRGNPLDIEGPQTVLGSTVELNARATRLIAFFQFKSFALMMVAYVATLLYVRDRAGLNLCVKLVGLAGLIYALSGMLRLGAHPEWVVQTIPLYLDTMSVLVFILIAFYVIAAWSQGLLSPARTVFLSVLAGIMMLFVLVSFRRTMWGAMILAAVPLLVFMPGHRRNYLLVAGAAVAFTLGAALLLSPVGETVMEAVSKRLGQTTGGEDYSAEYRFVLFGYFADNFFNIPLFGHGPKPLWNETVMQGRLEVNLENIHSLYFWLWLRLGHVGLAVFVVGMGMILAQAWALARRAPEPRNRVLALMLLMCLLMILFNGIFNPGYGQTRAVILTGIALALLSRMIQWDKSKRE